MREGNLAGLYSTSHSTRASLPQSSCEDRENVKVVFTNKLNRELRREGASSPYISQIKRGCTFVDSKAKRSSLVADDPFLVRYNPVSLITWECPHIMSRSRRSQHRLRQFDLFACSRLHLISEVDNNPFHYIQVEHSQSFAVVFNTLCFDDCFGRYIDENIFVPVVFRTAADKHHTTCCRLKLVRQIAQMSISRSNP